MTSPLEAACSLHFVRYDDSRLLIEFNPRFALVSRECRCHSHSAFWTTEEACFAE